MKLVLAAIALIAPSLAAADTGSEAGNLTQSARNAARDGRCDAIPVLAARVRELDAEYYTRVFVDDPVIAGCDPASTRARPLVVLRDVEADRDEPPLTSPAARQRDLPAGDERSPATALAVSGGATLAGGALLLLGAKNDNVTLAAAGAFGLAVGPTAGHIYAGQFWNPGLGIRLASIATTAVGAGFVISCVEQGCREGSKDFGGGLITLGAIGLAVGTIYEIALASRAADRHNQHARAQLAITPIAAPQTAGLAFAGQF